jgi:hypothetical protein
VGFDAAFFSFSEETTHALVRPFRRFGAPSHRLEAQMQATARVLEINCQVIYIPGVMLISFGDAATHTSEINTSSTPCPPLSSALVVLTQFSFPPFAQFLKQANGLDLGKLLAAYMVYYNVRLHPLALGSPSYRSPANRPLASRARRSSTTRSQSRTRASSSMR